MRPITQNWQPSDDAMERRCHDLPLSPTRRAAGLVGAVAGAALGLDSARAMRSDNERSPSLPPRDPDKPKRPEGRKPPPEPANIRKRPVKLPPMRRVQGR
jgi:hypothetical protein